MRSFDRTCGSRSLVAGTILSLLLISLTGFLISGPASGQGMLKTVAVLPFVNKSDSYPGEQYGREAADAFALALEETKQYEVASGTELEAVLRARDLWPPLDEMQLQAVGKDLGVDMVTEGTITGLNVNLKTGQASAGLNVRLLDVQIGEFLSGARAQKTTGKRPRPAQYVEDQLIGDALHEVAAEVVAQIISRQVPKGTVLIVDDTGAATLSLGFQEGLREGYVVVTLRPTYVPETGLVILRKVGTMDIVATNPHLSVGKRRTGQLPMVRDEFLLLYTPEPYKARQKQRAWSSRGRIAAGLAVVGALFLLATGESTTEGAGAGFAYEFQQQDGGEPGILITLARDRHPSIVVGYIVHRGLFRDFQPDANGLSIEQCLNGENNRGWLDTNLDPQLSVSQDATIGPRTFVVGDEEVTVEVEVTFTHDPLVEGQTYWYRDQRVTKPKTPPGANPPGAGAVRALQLGLLPGRGVGAQQIDWDPAEENVTDPTQPFDYRGVTLVGVPILIAPLNGALGQQVNAINFEWSAAAGADQYALQVFANPAGSGKPILNRQQIRFAGASHVESVTFSPNLSGNTVHSWRVGARADNETLPNRSLAQNNPRRGYVWSELRTFTTVPVPPPPP